MNISENLSNIEQYLQLAEKTIKSNPENDSIEDYHLIPLISEDVSVNSISSHPSVTADNLHSTTAQQNQNFINFLQNLKKSSQIQKTQNKHALSNSSVNSSTLSNKLSKIRVNGLLSINKNEITDIELAITQPDTSKVYRSNFILDRRWRLCQIHETQLILKKILMEFQMLKICYDRVYATKNFMRDSENFCHLKNNSEFRKIKILLKNLHKNLIKVNNRLKLPAANSLRSLSRSKIRTIFKVGFDTSCTSRIKPQAG